MMPPKQEGREKKHREEGTNVYMILSWFLLALSPKASERNTKGRKDDGNSEVTSCPKRNKTDEVKDSIEKPSTGLPGLATYSCFASEERKGETPKQ